MYPNPATNELTIKMIENSEALSIHIFDVLGRNIKTVTLTNSVNTIDISSLDAGIYFVQRANEVSSVMKFIKK